jgi:hypothetical protein
MVRRFLMRRAASLALLCLLAACQGATSDPGLSAMLRVADAQFAHGALPKPNGGPHVLSAHIPHDDILPGLRSEDLRGSLDVEASALLVGLKHDTGYWILTAEAPTIEEPGLPSFSSVLSFSPSIDRDTLELQLAAVDRKGRVGPVDTLTLHRADASGNAVLRVRLSWDSDADLDLHVVDPDGVEIWAGNINSYVAPPPGTPVDADAWEQGGLLDFDSNANCVIDGRRQENVSWAEDPPAGHYLVRVATASMCGAPAAHYTVEAWWKGRSLGSATGTGISSDTREGAQRGDGTFALGFHVP